MTIFWGTFFPLISELFTGEKSSLAAPWFDRYTTPLAIVLVLFTGIGPLLAWRRVSWASAKRVFLWPLVAGALTGLVLLVATSAGSRPWALALFMFAAFALTGLAQEFWRGAAGRRALAGGSMPSALVGVVSRNRRRYGGYIVHVGVVVLLIGIAASSSFQTKRDVVLQARGERGHRRAHDHLRAPDRQRHRRGARVRRRAPGANRTGRSSPSTRAAASFGRPGSRAGRSAASSTARRPARSASAPAPGATSGPRSQPNITAIRRRALASDRGFRECVRGAPGTPPQCRAVSRLMQAAAAAAHAAAGRGRPDPEPAGGDRPAPRPELRRPTPPRPPSG